MISAHDSVNLNILLDGQTLSTTSNVRYATAYKMFAPFVLDWSELMGDIEDIYQCPTLSSALQEMESLLLNKLWGTLEEEGAIRFHGLDIEFQWVNKR